MKPVIFHVRAAAEFDDAIAYYEGQRVGLGRECRCELEAALQRIRENPSSFPRDDDYDARFCIVNRFPFTFYFDELPDSVWIAAVAHHARRPGYWAKRSP
jgi:toxin ParE1/3/4